MQHRMVYALLGFLFLVSCGSAKGVTAANSEVKTDTLKMEQVEFPAIEVKPKKEVYKGSATRRLDLIHTKLEVEPVWENQTLKGEAWLTFSPYFYAADKAVIDAKGMAIERVELFDVDNPEKLYGPLKYTYDSLQLHVSLDDTYTRDQSFGIYIKYVARPELLELNTANEAIDGDKGLYFIDPLGEDDDRPTELWTQGEPEASSCWFPTIDKPNERCTQDLSITVRDDFITLSNGLLESSKPAGNGMRTDRWVQDQPHAPYLFMMAIGQWHEHKDSWNGMSVNYYVHHKYADVADELFGNTPEMMTFYSDLFKVEYPWDKYWQVCVTDFVSGAMENTTAVIHGEFVQLTERELLDNNYEDIVAHELVHHWFGDLVTCESWANLPLNESFATYGEVLWKAYKYGDDEGMLKVLQDEEAYFNEAQTKQVDLIRFDYDNPNGMFDRHSYQKGSCVLHMLRDEIGDDAFFEALGLYLKDYEYEPVEIHQLRLATEEITGRDMNWFFNQWFLDKGHPVLTLDYKVRGDSVYVDYTQTHSADEGLVYTLPVTFRVTKADGSFTDTKQTIKETEGQLSFYGGQGVTGVEFDPHHVLLAEVTENKPVAYWREQYERSDDFRDRLEALEVLLAQEEEDAFGDLAEASLADEFWYVREFALTNYGGAVEGGVADKVLNLAKNDENTDVRAAAIDLLASRGKDDYSALFNSSVEDRSYRVQAAGLMAMSETDPKGAMEKAKTFEDSDNFNIIEAVGTVYADHGGVEQKAYFEHAIETAKADYYGYYGVYFYSQMLMGMEPKDVEPAVDFIVNYGETAEGEYVTRVAASALQRIAGAYGDRISDMEDQASQTESATAKTSIEQEINSFQKVVDRCEEALVSLMAQ